MIELNADESMLLLLTKNWRHKDVYSDISEDRMSYIQKCCNYRCFGHSDVTDYKADVWAIYADIAIKCLSSKQIINAFEYVEPSRHLWKMTKIEAIISELSCLQVRDGDNIFIKFDESLMDMRSSEEYYSGEMDNEYY